MIIETHSGDYVNSDKVCVYFIKPVYRDEPANKFTGHITRPLDHLLVRAAFDSDFSTLGVYKTPKSANAALREMINSLRNGDNFHAMAKEGAVDNVQAG